LLFDIVLLARCCLFAAAFGLLAARNALMRRTLRATR
jgi:hypothetical protein